MGKIRLLDCTLRDGGYCNQWSFGENNIRKIVMGLEESGVEIIECGFLNEKIPYSVDCSRFNSLSQAECFITKSKKDVQYVCMANYGDIDIEKFAQYENGIIDGIRVAFHKNDINGALRLCRRIKEKGYKVYMQPMVVLDYTDEEFLKLVHEANEIKPYAFYIVDSFGVMKKKELIHIYYMIEHNLDADISIGFHSHNNIQLSYSNAQALLELRENRDIIIDSSIFGMGRGAGNLNTELFEQHLNDNYGKQYKINPLLIIYDEILSVFYNKKSWGYSLANYLSAKYNCHPNYATFLEDKNTLSVGEMNKIFGTLDKHKKNKFDKQHIENLYMQYMSQNTIKNKNIENFYDCIRKRNVLIIAPGKSSKTEKKKIIEFIKENNSVVISINMEYPYYTTDFVFVSNIRRYKQIDKSLLPKMIITSNILCDSPYLAIDYDKYTNTYECVEDNAILMLIKFLMHEGIQDLYIAGLDGYSHDLGDNYADDKMILKTSENIFDKRNKGITLFLNEVKDKIHCSLITLPKYIVI